MRVVKTATGRQARPARVAHFTPLLTIVVALVLGRGEAHAEQDRSSPAEKGSLLVYPNVEVRWSSAPPYAVIQDTFLHLANDFPDAVDVKLYFVNGDAPLFADPARWDGGPPLEPNDLFVEAFPSHAGEPSGRVVYARDEPAGLSIGAEGGMEHGIAISIGLEPRCTGEMIEGTMTVRHNDPFGDSTRLTDAYFTVETSGERFPPDGTHLEITAVDGNTTAGAGDELPVLIGQAQSTLSGLPGLAQDGEVTFRLTGYVLQPDDPDFLRVTGHVEWQDLCDEPDTIGCDTEAVETAISARTGQQPRIRLRKTSDESACDAGEKEVSYTYEVTNPGMLSLVVDLTDDPPCDQPVFTGGDDAPANGLLDPGETWTYACDVVVPGGTTSHAVVTGTAGFCAAADEAQVTIGACGGPERDHPGWNHFDNIIHLTANEPAYWSAATGLPKGVAPWPTLDPGGPGEGPGRPDPDDPSQRYLRGFVVAFAIQQVPVGDEIRWNHLAGDATIVNYREEYAWEYGAPAFQVIDAFAHGAATGTPGTLFLDGTEYTPHGQMLLLNFIASNSDAYSGAGFPVSHDTALTLMPLYADFRQETEGPRTTKAKFDIWNENEVKFTNLEHCVTCWSSRLLSSLPSPNHFLVGGLHTDGGKARIDGVTSGLCAPDDARATALVGVAAKMLSPRRATGQNLFDIGTESGLILYDPQDPPPGSRWAPPGLAR